MFCFNMFRNFRGILYSFILIIFSFTSSCPVNAFECNLLDDAMFIMRLEKLIKDLKKSQKKGVDEIIDSFLQIKDEVESTYKIKFNLDKCLNQINEEIKKQGQSLSKEQMNAFRTKFREREKARNIHRQYVLDVMYIDDYLPNDADEQVLFQGKEEPKEEKKDIPTELVFGVTCALCGVFIILIPIPICQTIGKNLITLGVGVAVPCICKENDERKKEKDDH